MRISLKGFNENYATLEYAGSLKDGNVVKLTASGKVGPCSADNAFCGVITNLENDGCAAVQLSGYIEVPYTDTAPTVGYCTLAGNGSGGVKVSNTQGHSYLVLNVDTALKTVGFIL